jgi:YEATS domain-containing protein 4
VIEGEPGKAFTVEETGWGEFEISMKLYYVAESGEKPQTLYHHLRLHPYGRNDAEREAAKNTKGEVTSWTYEEQIFNEPYETFYEILTSGAHPKGHPMPTTGGKGGKGKAKGKPIPPLPDKDSNTQVWERSAMIPATNKPGQPFSRETEALEIKKLADAFKKVQGMVAEELASHKAKDEALKKLREENAKATGKSG